MSGKELFEKMGSYRWYVKIGYGEVTGIFIEENVGKLRSKFLCIGTWLSTIAEKCITAIGYFGTMLGKLV
jgi:hypothetical protein